MGREFPELIGHPLTMFEDTSQAVLAEINSSHITSVIIC